MSINRFIVVLFSLLSLPTTAYSADTNNTHSEDANLDSILSGFDSDIPSPQINNNTVQYEEKFPFSGYASIGASYNYAHQRNANTDTDHWDLARLQTTLKLEYEKELTNEWKVFASANLSYDASYGYQGRHHFSQSEINQYEKDYELSETFIQGTLNADIDLSFGRQIVVWGYADNLRVLDVLNPLDNREPGIIDIEELRLPVYMTKLDYFFKDWNFTAIAIHEIRFNKEPVFDNAFFPYNMPLPNETEIKNGGNNTEYALALKRSFKGWDLAFHWARFFDDEAHIDANTFARSHSKLTMIGNSINIATGNWLFKSEIAYFKNINFFATGNEEKSRLDLLLGFEYYGISDTVISLEALNRHINQYNPTLNNDYDDARQDEKQLAFMYKTDFKNDTMHFLFLANNLGFSGNDGAFQRISIEYDATDDLSLTAGFIFYHSGQDIRFRNISGNDRLFLEAKYNF